MIRSRAPLRLGLAGGGTDVSPYSEIYGGSILNATISMFSYASIRIRSDNKILIRSIDQNLCAEYDSSESLPFDGRLDLLKAVYNRVVRDYIKKPLSFELVTNVDAPPGSGLGTSSTVAVSVLGAFVEWLGLPLGEYDIAHLAYEIERKDLGWAGGKQDQYAATFGGFNFMEFSRDDKVIVNPLRVKDDYLQELAINVVLYYTGTSRLSSAIIESQSKNITDNNARSLEGMHKLKEQSLLMKEAILKGQLDEVGKILDFGWKYKKQLSDKISSSVIDDIYETAVKAGATGGKISGAGGGGFMMFYCPGNSRYNVLRALEPFGGEVRDFFFVEDGLRTWRTNGDKAYDK